MAKSFYELDYIIEINEKRIEQYLSAYQKVLERFTNIIVIYSAMTIFLTSILKTVFLNKDCPWFLHVCFIAFFIPFLISLIYTVKLVIPVNVAYLRAPEEYYVKIRMEYERDFQRKEDVENLIKASYIIELEKTLKINEDVYRRKSSFYYNALIYSLISAVPYIICIGFHIARNEDTIQKIEIVNAKNK